MNTYADNKIDSKMSMLLIESEYWLTKSLELAIALLPSDTPLTNHIEENYKTHFSLLKIVIEEDKEHNDEIKWLHPSKGIY